MKTGEKVEGRDFRDYWKEAATNSAPLLLIMLVGLGLRLAGLQTHSLSFDEATSVAVGKMPAVQLTLHLLGQDVHPPLYFLVLHSFLTFGDSEWLVRLPSVIFGLCSIPAIFLVARRLFDNRVALIAASVLAVSPFHVHYSQMARPYSLWTLLSLLTWLSLIRALRTGRPSWWFFYALASVGALSTHYLSIITLVFQNLSALVIREKANGWMRSSLVANSAVLVPFAVWMVVSGAIGQDRVPGWLSSLDPPALSSLSSAVVAFSLGPDSHLMPRYCRLTSYPLFAALLLLGFRRKRFFDSVLSCWILFLIPLLLHWILSRVQMLFVWRYLSPYLFPYFLLLSVGLTGIVGGRKRILAGVLLGSFSLAGVWFTVNNQNEDWRSVTNYILGQRRPQDVVIVSPSWYRAPLDYYSRGAIQVAEAEKSGTSSDAVLSGADRVWLIEPFRHHWTELKRERIRVCLSARFAKVESIEIPQWDGRILCYTRRTLPH